MVLIGAFLLILVVTIILISKLNLAGMRVFILFLLPSFLFAFYASVIESKDYSHMFEGFGIIFMLSLYIMSPALLLFATGMVWIKKKFQLNLLILTPLSVLVGGLSASPYYFLASDDFFMVALYTAPIAVLLEELFNRWINNRRIL